MSVDTFVWRYSDDDPPFAVRGRVLAYRGPRFEGVVAGVAEDGSALRAAGPGVGEGLIEWGESGGDLKQGVRARLGDAELRLHRPHYGLGRGTRGIRIEGDPAGPLLLRLRRFKRRTLEDSRGRVLVSYGFKGRVGPEAEARHVALLLAMHVGGLDRLLEARLEQIGFFPSP